ncbi:MAG: C4-dicarboxylate ABC transporter substrate-binding protein [Minwuia thermotolerans]|nr:MAG: C4-dicarboxylate ABC transporter substrate-binding protein [Minwuia thermotolerans]
MKSMKFLAAAAAVAVCATTAMAEEKFVTVGTGGQTGVYYVVGQSICKLVNRDSKKTNLKCTAPSTGGSIANINAIKGGDMDMGVAQSDWQFHGLNGTSKFADSGAFPALRSVFSVHPEPFTVIARADSGIKSFDDLKGKRVNIGNPGSGQRGTMEVIMGAVGWTLDDFALASELKSSEQSQALCDNKVDAIIFTVGHPNGSIQEATTSCEAIVVPVQGPAIDKLVDENPYYSAAAIPGGMYKGTDSNVPTFGVRATFVSSTNTDADTIYSIVKAVMDNFDRFKRLHPAFANLDMKEMVTAGNSAPLHDGAARYYKEKGLMN